MPTLARLLTAAVLVVSSFAAVGGAGAATAAPDKPVLLAGNSGPVLSGIGDQFIRVYRVGDIYKIRIRLDGFVPGSTTKVIVRYDHARAVRRAVVADSAGRVVDLRLTRPASKGRHKLLLKTSQSPETRSTVTNSFVD